MNIEEEIARAIGENFQACRGRNGVSRTELAAALMPLLNRVRAEAAAKALREAADGLPDPVGLHCNAECHKSDAIALRIRADRIEQNSEGNEA